MSVEDICTNLLADWVPSLPAAVSSSFIGWPPFLLEPTTLGGTDVLALRELAVATLWALWRELPNDIGDISIPGIPDLTRNSMLSISGRWPAS
jgi:hypothetical protein